MNKYAKKVLDSIGIEIRRKPISEINTNVVNLKPKHGTHRGTVLMAYILKPFLEKYRGEIPFSHTHFGESLLMADVLLKLGYEIDVIDYNNNTFVPDKKYDVLLSARKYFQRYAELLGDDCVKIVHLGVSHWLSNNAAAINRCLDVQRRKGVSLKSYRHIEENWAIEYADYAIMLGNEATMSSYSYADKPIYHVPVPTCTVFDEPAYKDVHSVRRNFMWFGSHGFVHKGLDIVLEAFSQLPEYTLTVCGPLHKEKDFEKAFHKELYETENINTLGWVDVSSKAFKTVTDLNIGLVYPSSAEGQSGSVLTCMQAGVIPMISKQSGVDINPNYGVMLKDISTEEVKACVKRISRLPESKLRDMTFNTWQYARENHTNKNYSSRYEEILRDILWK